MTGSLKIHTDGTITRLELPTDAMEQLATLREEIGCSTVVRARLTSTMDLWVDDEGMITQPPNVLASILAGLHRYRQMFHGHAVVCSSTHGEDLADLTADQANAVLDQLRRYGIYNVPRRIDDVPAN